MTTKQDKKSILVIVESPTKISKIKQYLPTDNNYIVTASCGHILDLDKKSLSIDVQNNFELFYITMEGKHKIVNDIKKYAEGCSKIILAADGDREGEFIAYSIDQILKHKNTERITFNEITKSAILNAINNPKTINIDMVNAQKARRALDRLIGFEISPELPKDGQIQSAGRVQSIVLKIIIDKEKEINDSISEVYLKTIGDFKFNDNKINSILLDGTKNYLFDNIENANNFLKLINKNTIFKVINIENKKSIRKPSPPFITSTLQQESSTKLHFNIKKTMDIAQKLYDEGYITYMRTDCPNISKDAINSIEKYIISIYGKEYSDPKNYNSKNANSQDAHECIRPTTITKDDIDDNINNDAKKLYKLIWKRTIASQMANAKINIQTINIDAINKKSILIFNNIQTYFTATFENIEFNGYLIIYDNTKNDENDSEKKSESIDIKINDILNLTKIKISEEYTKIPLRYNESLLVKCLEKNGIGRPSTYVNMITKVIERNYVEIKDIDGIKKESKIIELNNKFKINESIKEIVIGKENKKIISTERGQKIYEFMIENFDSIFSVDFTATFETYLDKISISQANITTVLKQFYDMFHPSIEKLKIKNKNMQNISNDILFGKTKDGNEIFKGTGKYGPYVKIKIDDKWKYASIKKNESLDLFEAITLLSFPIYIGKINSKKIYLYNGEYGYYIKYMDKNISIKNNNINEITIDYINNIIAIQKKK